MAVKKDRECFHRKKEEIARTDSAVEAKTALGQYVDVHYRCLDCGKTFSIPDLVRVSGEEES